MIKTHTTQLPGLLRRLPAQMNTWQIRIPAVVISVHQVVAVLSAIALLTVFIILSVWVSELGLRSQVAGMGWGASMVFLALAVDNHAGRALLQLLTALALMILAWLQYNVASEWVIVSAALLAPWLTSGLYGWLQRDVQCS